MKYTAIVEIPKGCDRRIHMTYDHSGFVDFGPISDHISVNNGVMPVCYGYIDRYINKKEGDNVDCIIFSTKEYKTGDSIETEIIGILVRDDEDHKVICTDNTVTLGSFEDTDETEKNLILDYFGFKSKIAHIGDKEEAIAYMNSCIE
jgi:inorganic pyrophosphatase